MKNIFTISLLLALALFVSTDVRANHSADGSSTEVHTETTSAAGSTGTTGAAGGTAGVEIKPISLPVEVKTEVKPETMVEATSAALTTCGGKEKPVLSCPGGYMVGCSATGGERWACIKDPNAKTGVTTGAGAAAGATTKYLDQDSDEDGVSTILEDDSVKSAIYIKIEDVKGESEDDKKAGAVLDTKFQNGDIPTQDDFSVMIDSVKVRGWDPETKKEVAEDAPKTADAVKTKEDLALFVAAQTESDANIESVSLNFTKIDFKYTSQGKLFGFIPHKFTQDVSLEDNVVKVKLPWYSFLLSGYMSLDDLEAAAKEEKENKPMQIESWSFGANNAGSMSSGAGGAGKVVVASGDVNGDGVARTAADVAGDFAALKDHVRFTYDLKSAK